MTKATQAQLKATEKWRTNNPEKWKESRNIQVIKWREAHLDEAREAENLRHKRLYAFRKQFTIYCKIYNSLHDE